MYTIKHAAELTGLPEATLRAWERRYRVVVPLRTEGGYRLYDDGALAALREMRDLVADGWSARQAADRVRSQDTAGQAVIGATTPADAAINGSPDGSIDGSPHGSTAVGTADATELLSAAADLNPARLAAVLDDRFSRGSFETVVDEWLMPAMVAVGDAWAAGTLSTAAEHLTAHAVLRRLSAAFEAAAHAGRGPSVLVGLPPGCRHELGALAFATAARRAGLSVAYVGADLPVESWLDAVAHGKPRAVVLAVPRRRDVTAATSVMTAVHGADPELRVVVGGGQQDLVPEPAERLGHRIGAAADRLARELAGLPVTG